MKNNTKKEHNKTAKKTSHHKGMHLQNQSQNNGISAGCTHPNPLRNSNVKPLKTSPAKINRNQVNANWNSLANTIAPQKANNQTKKIGNK